MKEKVEDSYFPIFYSYRSLGSKRKWELKDASCPDIEDKIQALESWNENHEK